MNPASPDLQPSLPSLRIAVLGIGMMGQPMARRLCQAAAKPRPKSRCWNSCASNAMVMMFSPGWCAGSSQLDSAMRHSATQKVRPNVLGFFLFCDFLCTTRSRVSL